MDRQMRRQKRIQQNYRAAERLRKEKERKALKDEIQSLKRYISHLESRSRHADVSLPRDYMDHILRHASHEFGVNLGTYFYNTFPLEPWISATKQVAEALFNGMLPYSIWRSDDPRVLATMAETYMPDGYRFSFKLPDLRWDYLLDRRELRMLGGRGDGPLIAPDRDMYRIRSSGQPLYSGPETATALAMEKF